MNGIRNIMSRFGLLGEPAFAQTRFAVQPIPCLNGCPIGLYDPDLNLITVEPGYNEAVVLHELGHRVCDVYQNDLSEECAESFRRRYQKGVSLAAFMPGKGAPMRAVFQAPAMVKGAGMRAVHQAQMTMMRSMGRARGFPALSVVDTWSGVIYNVFLPAAAGKITSVVVWDYTDGTWKAPPLSIPSAGWTRGGVPVGPMALTVYFQNTSPVNQNMRIRVQWLRPDGTLYKEDVATAVVVAPGATPLQQVPGGGGGWQPDVIGAWSAKIYLEAEAG